MFRNVREKILAKNAFYLSYAHKREDVDFYLENIREVFKELSELIKSGEIESNLLGPTAIPDLKDWLNNEIIKL